MHSLLVCLLLSTMHVPCLLTREKTRTEECQEELITFDKTHYALFKTRDGERWGDVGARIASARCQIRSEGDPKGSHVWSSDHPSTQSVGQCPDDACQGQSCKGEPQSNRLYCSDYNTCKPGLDIGAACKSSTECGDNICNDGKCEKSSDLLGGYGF